MSIQDKYMKNLALGCTLLVFFLPGCRTDSTQAVAIEFWAMGREGEVVQRLIPEFERRYPGIKVQVQQIPWSAAHEKLLTAYAGEAMPDVFQLGNTWIPEFVALRAIEALDTRIANSASVVAEDYFPGILQTNVIEGLPYGIPWYVDTRLLFYRKDRLAKAGYRRPLRTWKSWLEAMTHLKEGSGVNHYAILLPINEWQLPVILALQLGAELLRDNDQYGNFKSPPFRQAFTFYVELFRQGLAPPVGTPQIANLYQEFATGYFSMYVSGPWNIGEFERRLPQAVHDQWSTMPMPGPDESYPGISLAGGASLAIARSSTHKAEAWKWIEYLSEPTQQLAFYRLTGDLPSRKTAWQDPALLTNPYTQAFWSQLSHLRSTPKIPEWERIASQIARYAEQTIRGNMSIDEALTALDREVNTLLEKRRWLLQRIPHSPCYPPS